jgi:hypothetical protein
MSRGLCFEFGVLEKERLEGISWQIADGRWSIIRRLAITNTTTLNSFEKNYRGPITGLELSRKRSFNFAEIQNHLKLLNFDF